MIFRVVIDTNVLISALLFHRYAPQGKPWTQTRGKPRGIDPQRLVPRRGIQGVSSQLVSLWQQQKITYLLTRPILDEYLRALAYPKFQLTDREIKSLIEEDLLPFTSIILDTPIVVPKLSDPDDEKFLQAALLGQADYLITGDKVLLNLKKIENCLILTPADFLEKHF